MSTTGVRQILRPATDTGPAFHLKYVRTGPATGRPLVVIPGGPGLGSFLPYKKVRRWAARGGLELIMVEHRGIGASRTDLHGNPLPQSAMRVVDVVDDIAAVLVHENIDSAFIVGSSYGSYLASSFGARHPELVAGMILDSALQSSKDLALERQLIRELFWDSHDEIGQDVRELASGGMDHRELLDVTRTAYELGGSKLLKPLLRLRLAHPSSLVWKALGLYAARDENIVRLPGRYEFDIAGAIGFRELDYGARPDGLPLDPALTYAPQARLFPPFAGEPYDLPAETPKFTWPMVLLAGTQDVRTPPAIARRLANTSQDAVFVEIENGHSALDTHPAALLNVMRALATGTQHRLPDIAGKLNALPRRGLGARLAGWLGTAVRVETALRR